MKPKNLLKKNLVFCTALVLVSNLFINKSKYKL